MAVLCRQTARGQPEQTYPIAPHEAGQSDADLLHLKAQGAAEKGWTVRWTGEGSFTAKKKRWQGVLCTRFFWIE